MGVQDKETRQHQKEEFEQLLAARTALLQEKGLDEAAIKKDKVIKQIEADIARTKKAIKSIEAKKIIIEAAHKKKEENAQKKKEAKLQSKSKKGAKASPKDAKKTKKDKKAKKKQ